MTVANATPVVFLSYTAKDRAIAAEVVKGLQSEGITVTKPEDFAAHGEELAALIREQIVLADALLVLATPEAIQSQWMTMEWGIAYAWQKPIFVVAEKMPAQKLPSYLLSNRHFTLDNLSKVVEAIRRAGVNLSDDETRWLFDWYRENNLPLDQLIKEPTLLAELAKEFRKAWDQEIEPERLLSVLYRARMQGNLPRLSRKLVKK